MISFLMRIVLASACAAPVALDWEVSFADDAGADALVAEHWGSADGSPGVPASLEGVRFGMTQAEVAALYPELEANGWTLHTSPATTLVFELPNSAAVDATPRLTALQLKVWWSGEKEQAGLEALWGEPTQVGESDEPHYLYWFDTDAGVRASMHRAPDYDPTMVEVTPYLSVEALLKDDVRVAATGAGLEHIGRTRAELETTFGDALKDKARSVSLTLPPFEASLGWTRVEFFLDGEDTVSGWSLAISKTDDGRALGELKTGLKQAFGKPERVESHGTVYLRYRDDPAVSLTEGAAGLPARLYVGESR